MTPGDDDDTEDPIEALSARLIKMLEKAEREHVGGMWVNEANAAFCIAMSPEALRKQREAGTGPRYYRMPRIRYDIADIARWLIAREVRGAESGTGANRSRPEQTGKRLLVIAQSRGNVASLTGGRNAATHVQRLRAQQDARSRDSRGRARGRP
jgi:hypothetical protein